MPIVLNAAVAGVLYVEIPEHSRFGYDDEDALVAVATQLGAPIALLQQGHASAEAEEVAARDPAAAGAAPVGEPVVVRRYRVNDSVFSGDDCPNKGVAGAIFWTLVSDFTARSRTDFSKRELRVAPSIRLPDIADTLEARLIPLQRRLAERCGFLRIEKIGRGRIRLRVGRPLKLIEVVSGGSDFTPRCARPAASDRCRQGTERERRVGQRLPRRAGPPRQRRSVRRSPSCFGRLRPVETSPRKAAAYRQVFGIATLRCSQAQRRRAQCDNGAPLLVARHDLRTHAARRAGSGRHAGTFAVHFGVPDGRAHGTV